MILTLDEIKNITFGALSVEEKDGDLCFFHATPTQTEAWLAEQKAVGERSVHTTGVCLDFHTDSSVFSFTRVENETGRPKFEVWVNGVLTRMLMHGTDETTVSVDLPEGENRVTLIFPSHRRGVIRDVTLSDGAAFRPHTYRRKIYFFGDSITQGWESGYDSLSWAWRVARFYDAEALIQGVGGAIFLPEAAEKVDFAPDMLIVALGVNHNGRKHSPDKVETDARETLEKLKNFYPNARKVALSPTWYRPSSGKEEDIRRAEEIRKAVEKVAVEQGYELIPGLSLLPAMPEFYSDGHLHPNPLGFSILAENIIRYLEGRG